MEETILGGDRVNTKWEITKSQILSMAESGLSIKHMHKLVNKYQYIPLSVIRDVLIKGGYSKNKNRTWSKAMKSDAASLHEIGIGLSGDQ